MGLDQAIARFRRRQEDLFTSEVLIERETGPGVFDPDTGQIGDPPTETVYEGPSQIRPFPGQGSDVDAGEREERIRAYKLKVRHDVAIKEGHWVSVVAAPGDPELVGQRFRITDVLLDDWQIVRVALMKDPSLEGEEQP